MIELRDIERTYSNGTVTMPVLKRISFGVEAGECVAIIGTSGMGGGA